MPAFKKLCLYLVLALCSVKLSAQTKPATKSYKLFFEKVYLHTDRDLYAGGDDIWFKAYLVNGQNNLPIGASNNLYVELLSPQGEMLNREIIRLDYGLGNGDIKLPDSIPSGKYRLRAYTNWMRNFADNFVFEKNIDIVNPGIKLPEAKTAIPSDKLSINFYPEGGSLIEGVTSLIAVKAQNGFGKGVTLKGTVFNTARDTMGSFTCDTSGMGRFTLLPLAGQTYYVEAFKNKQAYKTQLPPALAKGISLAVIRNDSLITTIINLNDAALADNMNHNFTISGKHGGATYFKQTFQITGAQALIKIPRSFFPEGIASLTLYDDQNKPHSERLVYIHHPETNIKLSISADKASYKAREKATINIKLSDTTAKANLSLTVVDESISPVPIENIKSYLLLQSELKGSIERPAQYFDTTNINRFKQLDLLMLTQGWRDFLWKRIADSAIRLSYTVENGFNVAGRVRQKLADKPVPGMNITLTAFKAKGQKLFSAKTDSTGRYYIPDVVLYGQQSFSITSRNNKGDRAGWLLLDSLTLAPLPVPIKPVFVLDTTTAMATAFKQREISIRRAVGNTMLKEIKITDKKTVIFRDIVGQSSGPGQLFMITKKDEAFETLDNWMAHNVKGAVTMDTPGVVFYGFEEYFKFLHPGKHAAQPMYPKLMVNGNELFMPPPQLNTPDPDGSLYTTYATMVTQMLTPYFNLRMDKVRRVEVRHLIGNDLGVITDIYLLDLRIAANALENKDFGLEQADVTGYYEAREFYKPAYDAKSDLTKTDQRRTIHWEPNITIGKNGSAAINFFNADIKNKMRYIVEGITDKGVPIVASGEYEVK